MDNASTVIPRTHYQFPPTEIISEVATRITNSIAQSIIQTLPIQWSPTYDEYTKLVAIAKRSKDAIKTIRYIPKDSRTPDLFMEPNGGTLIAFSNLIDEIKSREPYYPLETFDNLSRGYMLPGVEISRCDVCDRINIESLPTSKDLADAYNLELKEKANLCTFDFLSLCVEIEYLYPDINDVRSAPTLPDGRPVIWIGDPGWSKHPEEYRIASLKYQGNY